MRASASKRALERGLSRVRLREGEELREMARVVRMVALSHSLPSIILECPVSTDSTKLKVKLNFWR